MKEVNNAVNIPVTKKCRKCGQRLPAAFFYKKTKSKDGLQDSCKDCMNSYFEEHRRIKKLQKVNKKSKRNLSVTNVSRTTKLKRLSSYHLNYGLQYKIVGKLKKGQQREVVRYKCLTCGKEFTTDFDTAWSYRFNCGSCVHKIPGLPTNDLVKPNTFKFDAIRPWPKSNQKIENGSTKLKPEVVHEETFTATWVPKLTDEYNNHECTECKHNCEECSEQAENDHLIEKIKELREKATQHKMPHVHVIILEVPKIQTVPVTTEVAKDSFWTKIKKFFHRS